MSITDYTHKNRKILDIRLKNGKSNEKFFAILIDGIESILYVNYSIFNDRIKSYFLGKNVEDINRKDILDLEWNFIITQGFFYKITDKALIKQESTNRNKWFISVLEIVENNNCNNTNNVSLADFDKAFNSYITVV